MKDKDLFKEVFSEKLKEHSVDVNPQLWSSISSQVGASASAAGSGATLGLTGKIILGVAAVATLGTATYFIADSGEEKAQVVELKTEVRETTEDTKEQVILNPTVDKNEVESDTSTKFNKEIATPVEENIESDNQVEDDKTELNLDTRPIDSTKSMEVIQHVVTPDEKLVNKPEEKHETDKLDRENTKEVVLPEYSIKYTIDKNVYSFAIEGGAFDLIEWSFGENAYSNAKNASYFFETPGYKTVKAIIVKGDETIEKQVSFNVEVAGRFTRVPNTFTPSNDGSNDTYYIESEGISTINVRIVDESQNVVYESEDVNFVWDGIGIDGRVVPEGTYHIILIAEDVNGYPVNLHKTITIFR